MKKKISVKAIVTAALLCAIGIIIPMFSPIKIILEPASFTLASHVPIFIAMFISPATAIFVSIGTTLGFLLGGFPLVVVLRALSHVGFASIGALYLERHEGTIKTFKSSMIYAVIISIIHGVAELLIVLPFYFGASLSQEYYQKGFFNSVIILVGFGAFIHSIFDYGLAVYIWKAIPKRLINKENRELFIN
ncbi:hypothetical protein [Clostridium tarantellae]|uniref:ECF transporter S component n=1 Tax=Clostridium tarantellae TaxID=39493 RepID=A0A6I1MQ06_9CLOT|nr:hypothetical protein [Clostridium tarantellae]MPQ44950.1 hypothetical protein [Clostridium tarantellae]